MSTRTAAVGVGRRLTGSTRQTARRVRMPAFYVLTAGFLAFLLFALAETMAMAATGWLPDYGFPTHRVHHLMIGGLLTVFAASIAVQLYRPSQRVGAMQLAVIFVIAALVLTSLASGLMAAAGLLVFVVPVLAIAALHPSRSEMVPRMDPLEGPLLGWAAVGAIGFGVLAAAEYVSHTTLADDHVAFGHYEFMLIALVTIGLFAVIGALRPRGWRALVYAAAALAVVFAAGSLAFPGVEQGSSLGTIGAIAMIAWAIGFVGLAEFGARTEDASSMD